MSEVKPKIKCGILGATGAVGQRFITLLQGHPCFEIAVLGASERSAGKAYTEAASWMLDLPLPAEVGKLVVQVCDVKNFSECKVIFSGLDASVAGEIEEAFAKADFAVFSNSKNHRTDENVPILIPYVNADHIDVIPKQREERGYKKGFIVTNANCSTTGLVIALKPIFDAFGISSLFVVTMQAVSGAGYPGVSSYDITGNVIPFISGEESKLILEPNKIFGTLTEEKNKFKAANIKISAHCNRVHVLEGHTACVSIQTEKEATPEQVREAIKNFVAPSAQFDLPSAPKVTIELVEGLDRPQPRKDLGDGYTVKVGRVRECDIFTIKLVVLSHNTVIGAGGGSILNAELALAKGFLSD